MVYNPKHSGYPLECFVMCKLNHSEEVLEMVIFGDKTNPVYEVEMDRLNILTGRYEKCWDYVHANTEAEARSNASWIHGQSIEILNVQLHT